MDQIEGKAETSIVIVKEYGMGGLKEEKIYHKKVQKMKGLAFS